MLDVFNALLRLIWDLGILQLIPALITVSVTKTCFFARMYQSSHGNQLYSQSEISFQKSW